MLKFKELRGSLHFLGEAFNKLLALSLAELFDVLELAVGMGRDLEYLAYLFDYRFWNDTVFLVILLLYFAACWPVSLLARYLEKADGRVTAVVV